VSTNLRRRASPVHLIESRSQPALIHWYHFSHPDQEWLSEASLLQLRQKRLSMERKKTVEKVNDNYDVVLLTTETHVQ
jgi:hypothetical protein